MERLRNKEELKQQSGSVRHNLSTFPCVWTATCITMDAANPGACRQRIIRRVAQNFTRAIAAPTSGLSARWPQWRPAAECGRHPAPVPPRRTALRRHGVGALTTRRRGGARGRWQQIAASAATWDEQTPPEGVVAAIEAEDSAAGKITFVQAVSNTLNIMVRDNGTGVLTLSMW